MLHCLSIVLVHFFLVFFLDTVILCSTFSIFIIFSSVSTNCSVFLFLSFFSMFFILLLSAALFIIGSRIVSTFSKKLATSMSFLVSVLLISSLFTPHFLAKNWHFLGHPRIQPQFNLGWGKFFDWRVPFNTTIQSPNKITH